jgi:hypothetical protein
MSAAEDAGTKNGPETPSYEPTDFEFAEALGGGSENFSFWRLPLWPFGWIRLFSQEEE